MCARVHSLLYQLKMRETISQGLKLLHIPHHLYAILSHKILDVGVSAYRGPQHFDSRHLEHLWIEIIRNALKARLFLPFFFGKDKMHLLSRKM